MEMCFISSSSCPSITDWLSLIAIPVSIYFAYSAIKSNNSNTINGFILSRLDTWTTKFDDLTGMFISFYGEPKYNRELKAVVTSKMSDLSKDLSSLSSLMSEKDAEEIIKPWLAFKKEMIGDNSLSSAQFPNFPLKNSIPRSSKQAKTQIFKILKNLK